MSEKKGWLKRFLRWFRGDDLDEYLGRDGAPMLTAEVGEALEGADEGVSHAEAAALAGTATAVVDAPPDSDDWPVRRTFIDESGSSPEHDAPETVDEDYVLSHESIGGEEEPTSDRTGEDDDGISLTRVPPRPEELIIAKVDESVGQVTDILSNVNTALVQQCEVVEGLAKSMAELPAAVRSQGVYLETLTRQMEAQNARSAELAGRLKDLPALLKALPEQGRAQLEFLQRIADTLQGQAERDNALAQRVNDAYATLETIHESTRTQTRVLQEMDRTQRAVLDTLQETSELSAKRYTWLMCLMWAVTVVTVGGIAFVVYWLTRHLPAG